MMQRDWSAQPINGNLVRKSMNPVSHRLLKETEVFVIIIRHYHGRHGFLAEFEHSSCVPARGPNRSFTLENSMSRRSSAFLGVAIFLSTLSVEVMLYKPTEDCKRERISEAMRALDFWTASRTYPDAEIPADRYFKAYLDVREMRSETDALVSVPAPWTSIGPTNFAGRTLAIAINPRNPNTIYIGTAAGGLWCSHTGGLGADWQRVATGFPVLGVNAIAIQATDTSTIYVGTGEVYRYCCAIGGLVLRETRGSYGLGILKTTNSGATWTKSLDWTCNQRRGVECIRINPLNPFTVFAATSEGVYRSTDGGATWLLVLNALMAQDIAINPVDTTLVLATCGNFASTGRGVYRSTNGGVSFAVIGGLPSFTGKAMLEMYGANPRRVYLSLADTAVGLSSYGTGSLRRSTNFGETWTVVSNEAVYGVQGWYSQFVAVHPTDSMQVVRGTMYLYKSTNGGVSSYEFPYLSSPWADYHSYAHHPTNPNILYIVDDGGVWRSTNFGTTYQSVNGGLLTSQFYNGFSCSAQDSNRALGQVQDHFGWMYMGSAAWPSGAVDEAGWTAINQSNDMLMYAVERDGDSLYRSTNRGMSFFVSMSGVPPYTTGAWNSPLVISKSNPNYLYFGRAIIYRSTNAGAYWYATNGGASLDGNPALSMAVSATSQDTVFVGTAPGSGRPHIFRTTNAGTSWTNVTGDLPNRYPVDIAIDPIDSRIVYVAFGGFDTTRLAKSTNAGLTWTHINSPLPNVPTTAVAIDPFNTNHVYVGNDLGVFVSADAGSTWASFNDGLFEAVMVGDLVISPSNRSIKLATHSNGVFTRKLLSSLPTGVEEERRSLPDWFMLHQNFPNPFNPTTHIPYSLSRSGRVALKVFDIAGRGVVTLVDQSQTAGLHIAEFEATSLASGVYVYRLEVEGRVIACRKALLLR
ncbi:MAG TPA: hypothetical protein DGH68_08165 [Bacteroidetes bacterium]|nr:hypothetical protein [Bacteroidota bacterium]